MGDDGELDMAVARALSSCARMGGAGWRKGPRLLSVAGWCVHAGREMDVVNVGSGVRFVGRAVELDVLRAVVEDAATGRGRIALVEGEAGIGKSRVIAETLAFARRRGFRVLWGACDEVERDRPLRALREALEIERGAPDPSRA